MTLNKLTIVLHGFLLLKSVELFLRSTVQT